MALGELRRCRECGQDVTALPDRHLKLAYAPLLGPRGISSSNIDRICTTLDRVLDNSGSFLFIEEKNPGEEIGRGQLMLMRNLARLPKVFCWIVRGTQQELTVYDVRTEELVVAGTWSDLQEKVRDWFEMSDLQLRTEQARRTIPCESLDPLVAREYGF